MKLTYRWISLAVVVAVAVAVGYLVMTHLKSPDTGTTSNAPKIGYVNMENIVKLNPSYQQYKQLEKEYKAMRCFCSSMLSSCSFALIRLTNSMFNRLVIS